MNIRWAHVRFLAIFLSVLLLLSHPVNAGSFKDFILDEGLSSAQYQVEIPSNSKSASCMTCHDGSRAKGVSIKHADTAMMFTNHGSSNHPVGMDYASYARKSPASYVAPARLDSRIKLEKGQVTCISCHKTKSNNTKSNNTKVVALNNQKHEVNNCNSTNSLTTGSRQTSLCMSCHAM